MGLHGRAASGTEPPMRLRLRHRTPGILLASLIAACSGKVISEAGGSDAGKDAPGDADGSNGFCDPECTCSPPCEAGEVCVQAITNGLGNTTICAVSCDGGSGDPDANTASCPGGGFCTFMTAHCSGGWCTNVPACFFSGCPTLEPEGQCCASRGFVTSPLPLCVDGGPVCAIGTLCDLP
jgi:hypothetical protein